MSMENPLPGAVDSPVPTQGADTEGTAPPQAPPQAGILGASGLGQIVAGYLQHLTANQPPPVSSVVAKAKADADAAKPVDATPPPPGSFGSKLAAAGSGVMGAFGDAAHASDTKGGWLSGVANTLNARNLRLAQEAKDQQLLAKTQAETVMMHRNIYQQDAAIRQASYKGNQDFVDTFKVNHDVDQDVSHDQLLKRANADKAFASKYFVRATADEPVLDSNGEPKVDKKTGNPVTTPTYAIITRATKDGSKDDKEISPEMSGDLKKFTGVALPPKTKLTTDQYAALDTSLNNSRNAVNILNTANGKELPPEQMKTISPYLTDPTIQSAIAHVPGSPYAGLLQYQQNADAHIKDLNTKADAALVGKDQQAYDGFKQKISDLTTERDKVAQFTSSGAISVSQIERYNKDGEEGIKWVDKILHDPTSLSGDKASSVIPQLEEALKTETDPGRRGKLTSAVSAAKAARDNYFGDMDRKAKADQMAKQGDPEAAGKALAGGEVTLADLKTRGTTADFILKSIDVAKRYDKDYNAADEVNFEHIAKSPSGAQFFGSAHSLMAKGGTLDQLADWGKKIPENSLPVLNKYEDWYKLSKGEGPLAGYAALVLGVADDYGKVMGGGTASDSARDAALHLFAAAQTRAQREDAIRGTLGGVGSQIDGRIGKNKFLQREYGGFARSDYAPKPEDPNAKPQSTEQQQQATKQGQQTNPPKGAATRPTDLPKAMGAAPDPKTGKMYWHDAAGNVLREVKPGELPNG